MILHRKCVSPTSLRLVSYNFRKELVTLFGNLERVYPDDRGFLQICQISRVCSHLSNRHGSVDSLCQLDSCLILRVATISLYLLRVSDEEKMMIEQFGDEYREYMQNTGCLMPKLSLLMR